MKVISVVGTRPNFVKEFFIHNELRSRGVEEILVHTGQHYDYEMSKVFFEDFKIARPDYYFENSSHSGIQQISNIMTYIEGVLNKEKADCTLIYGDVNSTLAAAVASAKMKVPVAHVEGGIRSKSLYNPEEINRRVSDQLSMLILACTRTDYENLIKENFQEEKIVLAGDIMKDVILYMVKRDNIEVRRGDYSIVTIHREENVESKERLSSIILGLSKSREKIIFPVHPRTKQKLEEFGLIDKVIKNSKIEIRKPQRYREFVKLLAGANKVITDSGGVRREGYILKKPVVVLINITWFPEILKAGWKVVVDADSGKIADAVRNFEPPKEHPEIFGDGYAYKRIVGSLIDRFGDLQ
jgi:UDP-GlcNAc3NAcA epimerase